MSEHAHRSVGACESPACVQARESVERRTQEQDAAVEPLLLSLLGLSVQVCVDGWIRERKTLAEVAEIGRAQGDILACQAGEVFSVGGRLGKGRAQEAFASATRAIAAGSFAPGGIRFGGRLWVSHPEWLEGRDVVSD